MKASLTMKFLVIFAILIFASSALFAADKPNPRLPFNPEKIPPKPTEENAVRFVVLSDANSAYGSTTYIKDVHNLINATTKYIKPDIVVSAGDLIAAQKRGFGKDILYAMWAGFDAAVTKPLKRANIAFAPTPGNHDASGYPAFKIDRDVFRAYWNDPANTPDLNFVGNLNNFPTYYAHAYRNILFISMNITTMEPIDDPQWKFIEDALAKKDQYDFIFATAHVPPYPIAIGREKQCMTRPDADRMTKLFADAGVNVFFTGHHHAYYKARKKGLNLISLNACGTGPRRLIGTNKPQKQSLIVVDTVNGKITNCFALKSDNSIFSDETLPHKLQYKEITLHRFDSTDPDTEAPSQEPAATSAAH